MSLGRRDAPMPSPSWYMATRTRSSHPFLASRGPADRPHRVNLGGPNFIPRAGDRVNGGWTSSRWPTPSTTLRRDGRDRDPAAAAGRTGGLHRPADQAVHRGPLGGDAGPRKRLPGRQPARLDRALPHIASARAAGGTRLRHARRREGTGVRNAGASRHRQPGGAREGRHGGGRVADCLGRVPVPGARARA